MNTTQPTDRRRRHPPEYKRQLVALCQPGVSTSAVALAHGINTNLLRRWIKQYSGELPTQAITIAPANPAKLVAVQVALPAATPPDEAIEINIQKNTTRINIRWPGAQTHACGQWLGEWIK